MQLICHCLVQESATLLLNCYVYFRVQGLKFQGEDQSDLNDILQRVSAFGLFVYAVFSVIAGSLTAMTSEPNLLVMITGNLSVVQVCNKFINIDAKNNFLTKMLYNWHTSLIIWVLLETFCQIKKKLLWFTERYLFVSLSSLNVYDTQLIYCRYYFLLLFASVILHWLHNTNYTPQ